MFLGEFSNVAHTGSSSYIIVFSRIVCLSLTLRAFQCLQDESVWVWCPRHLAIVVWVGPSYKTYLWGLHDPNMPCWMSLCKSSAPVTWPYQFALARHTCSCYQELVAGGTCSEYALLDESVWVWGYQSVVFTAAILGFPGHGKLEYFMEASLCRVWGPSHDI